MAAPTTTNPTALPKTTTPPPKGATPAVDTKATPKADPTKPKDPALVTKPAAKPQPQMSLADVTLVSGSTPTTYLSNNQLHISSDNSASAPEYIYVKGKTPNEPDRRFKLQYRLDDSGAAIKDSATGKYLAYYKEQKLTKAAPDEKWEDTNKYALIPGGGKVNTQTDLLKIKPTNEQMSNAYNNGTSGTSFSGVTGVVTGGSTGTGGTGGSSGTGATGGSTGTGGAGGSKGKPKDTGAPGKPQTTFDPSATGLDSNPSFKMTDQPDSQGRHWSGTWTRRYDYQLKNQDGQYLDEKGSIIKGGDGNPITDSNLRTPPENENLVLKQPVRYECKDATIKEKVKEKDGTEKWVTRKVEGTVSMNERGNTGTFGAGTATTPLNDEPVLERKADGNYKVTTSLVKTNSGNIERGVTANAVSPQGKLTAALPINQPFLNNPLGSESTAEGNTSWKYNKTDGTYSSTRTSPEGKTMTVTAKLVPDGKGGTKVQPLTMSYDLNKETAGNDDPTVKPGVNDNGKTTTPLKWDGSIGGFVGKDSNGPVVRNTKGEVFRDANQQPVDPAHIKDKDAAGKPLYKLPISSTQGLMTEADTKAVAAKAAAASTIKTVNGVAPPTIAYDVPSPAGGSSKQTFFRLQTPEDYANFEKNHPDAFNKMFRTGSGADAFNKAKNTDNGTGTCPVYVSVDPNTPVDPAAPPKSIHAFGFNPDPGGKTGKPGAILTISDPENKYTNTPETIKADDIGATLPGNPKNVEFKYDSATGKYKATGVVSTITDFNGSDDKHNAQLTGDYEFKAEDLERGTDGKLKLKAGVQPRMVPETAKMTLNGKEDSFIHTDIKDPNNPGSMKRVFFERKPSGLKWSENQNTQGANPLDAALGGTHTKRRVMYMDAFDTGAANSKGGVTTKTQVIHKVQYGDDDKWEKDEIPKYVNGINGDNDKDRLFIAGNPYTGMPLKESDTWNPANKKVEADLSCNIQRIF